MARRHVPSFDVENFLRELDVIAYRVKRVTVVLVETFNADYPRHDSAYVVIVRLVTFLEREEYTSYMDALILPKKHALRTVRNIATHSGYQSMDD